MRASLSFLSYISLLYRFYYAATKEYLRSKRTSLLFEFLCGFVSFYTKEFFFHRTALNSAVKRNHKKEICAHISITILLLVPNVQTHI